MVPLIARAGPPPDTSSKSSCAVAGSSRLAKTSRNTTNTLIEAPAQHHASVVSGTPSCSQACGLSKDAAGRCRCFLRSNPSTLPACAAGQSDDYCWWLSELAASSNLASVEGFQVTKGFWSRGALHHDDRCCCSHVSALLVGLHKPEGVHSFCRASTPGRNSSVCWHSTTGWAVRSVRQPSTHQKSLSVTVSSAIFAACSGLVPLSVPAGQGPLPRPAAS